MDERSKARDAKREEDRATALAEMEEGLKEDERPEEEK